MQINYVSNAKVFKLRSRIRRSANAGPEQCRIVNRQLAGAEKIDLRIGGGVGRDFQQTAGLKIELAGARGGSRRVVTWSDPAATEAAIVGDVGDRIGAGQRPGAAEIVDQRLETAERA